MSSLRDRFRQGKLESRRQSGVNSGDCRMLKICRILALVLIIGGILGFPEEGRAAEPQFFVKEEAPPKAPLPLYVPDELIVKFKPGIPEDAIKGLLQANEVSEKFKSRVAKFRALKMPKGRTVPELIEIFKASPLVEYAEPNYYAYAAWWPEDPYYQYQWHFDDDHTINPDGASSNPYGGDNGGGIRMEEAWEIETGDSNVIVAVIDTGVAYQDWAGPGFWHLDTYNAYGVSGNTSWWCGVSAALPSWTALYGSLPTPPGYGNGWKQYLQHSFDLTSANGTVTFSYYYKHDIQRNYDHFYVDISDNGGLSWKPPLRQYTNPAGTVPGRPPGSGTPVDWTQDSIDLTTPYKGKNIIIRFRFNSNDSYSDEDGDFNSDGKAFDSDGAVYIDEVKLEDDSGTLFYDDMESGAGDWETTQYQKAPDLAGTSFVPGYDFVNDDSYPNDDGAHGTHVTGTIAQTTNNNFGVAGIAFNTTIMPIKVLSAGGTGTYAMIADGIYYATDNGAKIINLSLGGYGASATLESAVAYAYNNGVTIFAAAGNDNVSSLVYPFYPAAYDAYCIAVGATRYDETLSYYSNFGPSLDIVAPGGDVTEDQNEDGYADGVLQQTFGDTPVDWSYWFYQGTSMSTPHASGVAALLLAQNSSLTPDQIRSALQDTAEDLGASGRDDTYGWGLIDAQAALQSVVPVVSISLLTDGSVELGMAELGETADSLGDVQTVKVDTGPADLNIKSTVFSDGIGNTWALGTTNGDNQVIWKFSPDGSSWNIFEAADMPYLLASNVAENTTQDLYFRITMPTSSSSEEEFSATVTILATEP